MQPRIELSPSKKILGMRLETSLVNDQTYLLWSSFMPRKREIENIVSTDLYSVQCYTNTYFDNFKPDAYFEKWAGVQVSDFEMIPSGMHSLEIPEGLYAVFIHKGLPSQGHISYQYIFATWLPTSGFILDQRPHFACMGNKYKNNDPASEEELWIPIKEKM